MHMTILLGLPGAGKSTYIKHHFSASPHSRLVIAMDDLRLAYGHVFDATMELDVLYLALAMAASALERGHNVIIDESVTSLTTATALTALARSRGAQVHMVELLTPARECWRRRKACGFPRRSFEEKFLEWSCNREHIIALADSYRSVAG